MTTSRDKVPETIDYREYLLGRLRQDPEEALTYLNAALDEGEGAFLVAVKDVIDAGIGMSRLAEATELHRVSLYKMLSEEGNPTLKSLEAVLDAMGLQIAITLKDQDKSADL